MFGDKMMLGTKIVKIDEKGRVFLPSKMTDYKSGESVYVFLDKVHGCFIIQSENTVKQLGQKYLDTNPLNRNSELEKIGDYLLSCISISKIDTQGRLLLGANACSEIGISDESFLIGCYDEIRIYPNEESYKASIKPKVENIGIQLKK